MRNIIKPLVKSILIPLGLTSSESAYTGFYKTCSVQEQH